MLSVPRHWRELSPEWMTEALSGRLPGAVVEEVDVGPVHEGTNARARVRLTYAHGEGPPSVFVKAPGRLPNRLALAALGAVTAEARLAASGVELPLLRPQPYAAGIDGWRLAAVVVMDDVVADGGRPNDGITSLGVAEVRSGLEGLARLHAAWWGRALPRTLRFLRPWRLGRAWGAVSRANLGRGLRRMEEALGPSAVPAGLDAGTLGRQFRHSAVLAAQGPRALLHGDPHPGNTYRSADGRTGFLDWQLVRTGHWSHDVGYFLIGSLDVADRRRQERHLLAGYLDELGRAGVTAPSWESAWARYRAAPAFGLATWVHTLTFGTFQPVAVSVATLRRFAAAYEDLETARSVAAGG